jgi:hypothetical protein
LDRRYVPKKQFDVVKAAGLVLQSLWIIIEASAVGERSIRRAAALPQEVEIRPAAARREARP